MKQMDIQLNIKSLEKEGTFEGYASVFHVLDADQDRVAPGAFGAALQKANRDGGWPKLLWQHDPSAPIGRWLAMREDDHGLFVKGKLCLETVKGREAYVLLKNKAIEGLSIGYTPLQVKHEGGERILTAVALHEISLVTFPSNGSARVLEVKESLPHLEDIAVFQKSLKELTDILTKGGQA